MSEAAKKRQRGKGFTGKRCDWTGRKHTKEAKINMSIAYKARVYSEEEKRIRSENQKGKNNSFYGRKHTEATKKKIADANRRRNK